MTHTSGLKVIAAIKRVDQRSWLTICLTNNIFDTQVCESHLLGHSTNHGGVSVGLPHDCEVVHSVSEWLIPWRRGLLMAVRVMKIRNKLLQFRFYSHIFSQFLTCIGSSYWRKEDRMAFEKSNKDILEICKTEDMNAFIARQQKCFLAHIIRRADDTLIKSLTFNTDTIHRRGRSTSLRKTVFRNEGMEPNEFYKLAMLRKF